MINTTDDCLMEKYYVALPENTQGDYACSNSPGIFSYDDYIAYSSNIDFFIKYLRYTIPLINNILSACPTMSIFEYTVSCENELFDIVLKNHSINISTNYKIDIFPSENNNYFALYLTNMFMENTIYCMEDESLYLPRELFSVIQVFDILMRNDLLYNVDEEIKRGFYLIKDIYLVLIHVSYFYGDLSEIDETECGKFLISFVNSRKHFNLDSKLGFNYYELVDTTLTIINYFNDYMEPII